MATKQASEDFSCLYSDYDNDSDANPDDEERESPSNTTGPKVCQVESIIMATITVAVESGSAVPQIMMGLGTSSTSQRKSINLIDTLHQLDVDKVMNDIFAQLDKQFHFIVFEVHGWFLQALRHSKVD